MASIKRSEYEHLKRIEKEYYKNFDFYSYLTEQDLRDKLWTAEQEIHDLKEQAERNDREFTEYSDSAQSEITGLLAEIVYLTDDFVEECEQHDELKKQYSELLGVKVVQLVNELNNVPEELNPPDCLKPLEALEWNAGTFYSTPDYRTMASGMAQARTGLAMGPAQIFTKKAGFLKKHFGRITIGILLASLLGLGVISYRQNQVIQYQRAVIRQAITYVLQNCPPAGAVENNSLNSASK
jgi:hypothetical protein